MCAEQCYNAGTTTASATPLAIRGDQTCDSKCDNAACNWDDGDCGQFVGYEQQCQADPRLLDRHLVDSRSGVASHTDLVAAFRTFSDGSSLSFAQFKMVLQALAVKMFPRARSRAEAAHSLEALVLRRSGDVGNAVQAQLLLLRVGRQARATGRGDAHGPAPPQRLELSAGSPRPSTSRRARRSPPRRPRC